MDAHISPKSAWEHLLALGEFSIGQFVVSTHDGDVRVYHSKTYQVCHCPQSESYQELQRLCEERGYSFQDLLMWFVPNTYHNTITPELWSPNNPDDRSISVISRHGTHSSEHSEH